MNTNHARFIKNWRDFVKDDCFEDDDDDSPDVEAIELDNDFGEVYWNGSRMVEKPGFEDY